MTTQDLLTVEQVAEILHVSKNTLQRKSWRERTGCPLHKHKNGKRLYALVAEFHKWLKG